MYNAISLYTVAGFSLIALAIVAVFISVQAAPLAVGSGVGGLLLVIFGQNRQRPRRRHRRRTREEGWGR